MGPELYIVTYPQTTAYADAAVMDKVNYDYNKAERCPLCGRRVSGGLWVQPREIVLTNRRIPDFLYSYSIEAPFVISERALAVICQAGLTGIKNTQEIEYTRFQKKGKTEIPIPKYYYVELAHSKMTIDHEKSMIVYGSRKEIDAEACPLCHLVPGTYDFLRHLEFHTEQYEGYDIFLTYELGETTFLSKRFVEVCRENGLTNLHFRPAAKYGTREAKYFLDGIENDEDDK